MKLWVVRNGTADINSILLFRKKSDALRWLKGEGLIFHKGFWVQKKGDLNEYDYWITRETVN